MEDSLVLDVCAAPGGKSLHMAELLKGSGRVEARDISDRKTGLIEENARRGGFEKWSAVPGMPGFWMNLWWRRQIWSWQICPVPDWEFCVGNQILSENESGTDEGT